MPRFITENGSILIECISRTVASTATKLINYPSYNPIKNPFKTSSSKGEHGIAESREIFNWLLELVRRDINWIPPSVSCINRPSSFSKCWFVDNYAFTKEEKEKEKKRINQFLSSFIIINRVRATLKNTRIQRTVCRLYAQVGNPSAGGTSFTNFCPPHCLKFQVRAHDDFRGNYTRKL